MARIENSEKVALPAARGTAESFAKYVDAKYDFPVELDVLAKIVEVYFVWHSEWQGSPERVAERDAKRASVEAAKAAKKAAAEAKKLARDEARRSEILEAAKRLGIIPSDVVRDSE